MLTMLARTWGSSRWCRLVEGRTGAGLIARRSGAAPRPCSVVVEDGARDHSEANEMHGQMRQDTAKVCA